jgi:hypothetical protein
LKDSIKKVCLSAADLAYVRVEIASVAIYKQYASFVYNVDLVIPKKIYCIKYNLKILFRFKKLTGNFIGGNHSNVHPVPKNKFIHVQKHNIYISTKRIRWGGGGWSGLRGSCRSVLRNSVYDYG